MVKYAFYLAVKGECEGEECFIDTSDYHINVIWNGYELNKIFGIEALDFYDIFLKDNNHVSGLKGDREQLVNQCIEIMKKSTGGDAVRLLNGKICVSKGKKSNRIIRMINWFVFCLKVFICGDYNKYSDDYLVLCDSIYYDEFSHDSDMYFRKYKEQVKKTFCFPELHDKKNREFSEYLSSINSVAVHIRRSDHMYDNRKLFFSSYHKRAVNYLCNHVESPYFCVFSDDFNWCKKNLKKLGLNDKNYCFVDWNVGENSYVDMQLMTYCKHNVLVGSTFSWWGYYLSNRENKIVIAPKGFWKEVKIHI